MSDVHKRYVEVPALLVGFDTETTGLATSSDRAISYGFSIYEGGQRVHEEHFFVDPQREISYGAQRVHGISQEMLDEKLATGAALSLEDGVNRAVDILQSHCDRGAVIVGANVRGFDLAMLAATYKVVHRVELGTQWKMREVVVVDVIAHDVAMESRSVSPRRRSLTHLCGRYHVGAGGHDALGDARAAVEVFLAQVRENQRLVSMPRLSEDPNDPVEMARRWLLSQKGKVVR